MERIYCNKCGRELKVENEIPYEDFVRVRKEWGYFSKKDGKTQEFIICEECIASMEKEFLRPSKWCDTIEMM